MSAPACCRIERPGRGGSLRRAGEVGGWVLPGVILALLPKCPACLAAYVAIATGIGLSAPVAAHLHLWILILSSVTLVCMAASCARRMSSRRAG
jgi:hypothetical protein